MKVEIIAHRINSIHALSCTRRTFGVEVDIRSNSTDLIISHDPFQSGIKLDSWLEGYEHGTLILNVKEEGLEDKLLWTLSQFKIEKFFILDESFPYIIKWRRLGLSKFAVRVSDLEGTESARLLTERGLGVDWLWVDCFDQEASGLARLSELRATGYKICMVSPELHRIDDTESWNSLVDKFQESLRVASFYPDAVCTKATDNWECFSVISQ